MISRTSLNSLTSLVGPRTSLMRTGEFGGPRIVALRLVDIAPARRNDLAAVEEGVDDFDRLLDEAAGIVAQVEDIAFELAAGRGLELRHCGLQAVKGLFVELRDADIADVVALDM